MACQRIEFWFEFASTYSYLSAMRIDRLAAERNVSVEWKPFLLGPIFRSFGWNTSPFVVYPQKGAYMWRDMERRAARYGLPFRRLDKAAGDEFPQNSVAAARIALVGLDANWGRDFCKSVYRAQFVDGRNIADLDLLRHCAIGCGATDTELDHAFSEENKARLRSTTDRAQQLSVFGAPSFMVDQELYWGDDRLEDALMMAREGL